MKILVADDHRYIVDDLMYEIKKILPKAECIGTSDPHKVMKLFSSELFDIVFIDIMLPGANGIELAKKMLEIKPRTNIIYITGFSEYAFDSYETFASGFLLKPIKTQMLKDALENLRYPISSITDEMIENEYAGSATIGKRITKYREERGMSRHELAEQMNVTVQTISRWESGKRVPDVITFMKLAQVLAVDPNKLLGEYRSDDK